MTPEDKKTLTWVVTDHPQRGAMEYAIRLLCNLMGRRARFVRPTDADSHGETRVHYGPFSSFANPHLTLSFDTHFWGRVDSGADITPLGAAEWHGVMYPRWAESGVSRKSRLDESRVCPVDPVAATFFLVSRIEEVRSLAADQHGRFPAGESWMVRMGLIERPLVHDYATAIQESLDEGTAETDSAFWPGGRRWAISFTHDVDRLRMHSSVWRDVRSGVGGLRFKGGLRAAGRRLQSFSATRFLGRSDPYDTIDEILADHDRRGFKSTWFWIAGKPSTHNADYHVVHGPAPNAISRLRDRGHEVGLHGSYESFERPDLLTLERQLLEGVVGAPVVVTRQHYLRFRAERTWRAHQAAGLAVDSTLGFADRLGFRAGIAVPFRPWDFERQCEHAIWEVPLVMMDVTAREYMGLTPDEAIRRSRAILSAVQRVGGAVAVLWHNSSLNDIDWRGWRPVYQSWLDVASESEAWGSTLSDTVKHWQLLTSSHD